MSPVLLLTLLIAGILALLPVWRLHRAGWPARSLFTAWILYAAGIFLAVRFSVAARWLIPILVLAFVAPFVAGPERLTRLLLGRRTAPGVVIDVTPRTPDGSPEASTSDGPPSEAPSSEPPSSEPPRRVEGEVIDDPAGRVGSDDDRGRRA
jgi:hypothetical protein